LVFGFIIGAILGSFVKVLADRGLVSGSILGRSYCQHCQKKLQPPDLIPVVSYIILGGKCRYCHEKISIEYLIVEMVMGVLAALIVGQNLPSWSILNVGYQLFFAAVLVTVFLTDLKEMLIPDRIILPAIVIGFFFKFLIGVSFFGSVVSAILIGGFFLGLVVITRGKGMGGGDIKLGAFMGLSLGFPNGILAVMLGFLTGAVFAIGAILMGKKHFGESLPFGPFLVIGSFITLFWGNEILKLYLQT